jgi:hypothetical protein
MAEESTADSGPTAGAIRKHLTDENATWSVADELADDDVVLPFETGVSDEVIEALVSFADIIGGARVVAEEAELADLIREQPPTNRFLLERCVERGYLEGEVLDGLGRSPTGPHREEDLPLP